MELKLVQVSHTCCKLSSETGGVSARRLYGKEALLESCVHGLDFPAVGSRIEWKWCQMTRFCVSSFLEQTKEEQIHSSITFSFEKLVLSTRPPQSRRGGIDWFCGIVVMVTSWSADKRRDACVARAVAPQLRFSSVTAMRVRWVSLLTEAWCTKTMGVQQKCSVRYPVENFFIESGSHFVSLHVASSRVLFKVDHKRMVWATRCHIFCVHTRTLTNSSGKKCCLILSFCCSSYVHCTWASFTVPLCWWGHFIHFATLAVAKPAPTPMLSTQTQGVLVFVKATGAILTGCHDLHFADWRV